MAHACDKELPCNNHFTIFFWAIGIFTTVLTAEVYATIDNRNRAVDEHRILTSDQNKNYSEIIQRLARIEEKISK